MKKDKKDKKRVTRYVKRYEQWKRNVAATSLFVSMCGVVAIVYFGYRAVLIATPITAIEQSIFNSHKNILTLCQDDEGGLLKDPEPVVSARYEKRIQDQKPTSPNLVANTSLTHLNPHSGDPVGYYRSVDGDDASYEQRKEKAGEFLRVTNKRERRPEEVVPAWQINPVHIKPEVKTYAYEFWYRSTAPIKVSIEDVVDKKRVYTEVAHLESSGTWQRFTAHFYNTAKSAQFRFNVTGVGVGRFDTKGFNIHQIAQAASEHGIVSVAFDDGWQSAKDKALPLLNKYGIRTTQYVISEAADRNTPGYMGRNDLASLKNAGHEIGSHSLSHCNQTELAADILQNNATQSKQLLEGWGLGPVKTFSYPLGQYNKNTQDVYEKEYPLIRTSDVGYNDRYYDESNIRSMGVLQSTDDTQFQSWLTQAKENHQWVVLVYHRVDESGSFNVTSEQLERQLKLIVDSGLTILPISEAANRLRS